MHFFGKMGHWMNQPPNLSSKAHLTRGYLISFIGVLFWSTTGIFIRYLTVEFRMPPLVLAFWRDFSVAAALMLALAVIRPALLKIDRRWLGYMVLYGLLMAVFNSSWTFSVALNGAAVATVLAYSSPAFTAILSWRLMGEKLSPLKIGVVIVSIIGSALVAGAYNPDNWQVNPWGIVVGISTGVFFAFYSLMGKYSSDHGLNSWATLGYSFSFATFFLLLINLGADLARGMAPGAEMLWLGDSTAGWLTLIILGIGPSIGGFGLYSLSLSYLPATSANLIATLEPVLTTIQAYILLGEQLDLGQALGGILIIASVIVLRLREG